MGLLEKYESELKYWKERYMAEGNKLNNQFYKKLMLALAEREDTNFVDDKIVADFGCGPRGSICWAESAKIRIGIDVLSDSYVEFGITSHNMCYIVSTEETIPLPSSYVDILFTMNAMDHCANFEFMCSEIRRILKSGGEFYGSFNLEEPPSINEPMELTEEIVHDKLLKHFEITSKRMRKKGPYPDTYCNFFQTTKQITSGTRIYWVCAVLK